MCTVTYIPLQDKVFISHNRDEKSSRAKAIAPKEYIINGHTLLFPRDSTAGGTWIAMNKNGNAAVLLNGGFVNHLPQPPYRKSRGLIFLEIMASADIYRSYNRVDLKGIEPFTVILLNNHLLYECRWDGSEKHITELNAGEPHIWASATLYDETAIANRKKWLNNWLQQYEQPTADQIIQFHLSAGDGDSNNDLRIDRGHTLTVSITCMELSEDKSMMQYLDLQDNTRAWQEFFFTKAAAIQ